MCTIQFFNYFYFCLGQITEKHKIPENVWENYKLPTCLKKRTGRKPLTKLDGQDIKSDSQEM